MTEIAQVAWEYGGESITSTACWLRPGIELALALALAWLFAELEQPATATATEAETPTTATVNLALRVISTCLPLDWTLGRTLLRPEVSGSRPAESESLHACSIGSVRVAPISGTSATEKMTAASSNGQNTSNRSRKAPTAALTTNRLTDSVRRRQL